MPGQQPYSRFTIGNSQLTIDHSRFSISALQIRLLLFASLLVQIIFCITQVGFLHPDQHFQLIEFSSWQMGEPSGATSVWELNSHIRPTLQVYIFSAFVNACRVFHIYNAYTQLTVLRLLFGLLGFTVFNAIGFYYFKYNRKLLFFVLLLINFSWTLPYVRTLFSSEMASSIVFFGAILLYEIKKEKWLYVLLTGFLFSLAFYLRFQTAFGLAGFGLWMLLIERKYDRLLPMSIGFAIGVGINLFLDYQFYHQLVFTPYDYYRVNITEGKAAEFGTSSFTRYILMLTMVIGTPPLSIFLFYYSLKATVKQYRQPLVFAVVFFIIGHCLVAHKEERFLFPILNVLPIIAGRGLLSFMNYYQRTKKSIRYFLNGVIIFSLVLTILPIILLPINPYSQTVEFSRQLTNKYKDSATTIYCFKRTPFETESGLPLTFYSRNTANIHFIKFDNADSIRYYKTSLLATTYNDAKDNFPLLDSLGFKPQFYSSSALWNINRFLQSKKMNTINDIWVMFVRSE